MLEVLEHSLEYALSLEVGIVLVDSHAHLQWPSFSEDREETIVRAERQGVKNIVNAGFDVDSSRSAVELAESHDGLYATVGVHPHSASLLDSKALEELQMLSKSRKVVAIGETGLDYYRNLSPRKAQRVAFEAQMHLAEELELPIVIHDREAHADVLQILSKFKGRVRGVMHCFSGSNRMARRCIDLGYYISFAGSITFPNAHSLRRLVEWIDLNNVLVETDCPWLAPQEVRGRRNEPAFLKFVVRKIAALKRVPLEEVTEATARSIKKVFNLS